jgi:hypothetical protein
MFAFVFDSVATKDVNGASEWAQHLQSNAHKKKLTPIVRGRNSVKDV